MVGTSGRSGERSPTIASARLAPARTCSRIEGTVANVIWTWPATKSAIEGPAPR